MRAYEHCPICNRPVFLLPLGGAGPRTFLVRLRPPGPAGVLERQALARRRVGARSAFEAAWRVFLARRTEVLSTSQTIVAIVRSTPGSRPCGRPDSSCRHRLPT